jgi:putative SOS response-associated peptidase YedK
VWRHWCSLQGKGDFDTFAIITDEPNEIGEQTTHHNRMPLIVKKSDWQWWLEPGNYEKPRLTFSAV